MKKYGSTSASSADILLLAENTTNRVNKASACHHRRQGDGQSTCLHQGRQWGLSVKEASQAWLRMISYCSPVDPPFPISRASS